jgi:transcriptional regulator of arginine metabolism
MTKKKRQFIIREIVTKQQVSSQEELQRLLKKAGCPVNQATLSRDLTEMGINRMGTDEGPRYEMEDPGEDMRVRELLSYEVRDIQRNEAMIVIKTLAGRADGVAELIDSLHSQYILGTIAGDNTIFIAPRATKDLNRLVTELRGFITGE